MTKICKHPGCGNECPPERKSTRGFKIQYHQCNTCSNLISKYGIHNGERKEMLKRQNNKCAICDCQLQEPKQTLKNESNKQGVNLDHCHNSNKIRGLLCTSCNRALGLFKDSQSILLKAINYLNQHE